MRRPLFALSTLLLALAADAAPTAQAQRLGLGDPAPPLAVGSWIKGEPLTALGNGSVTVLDFWATWCGPCRQAIPHMSAIQKQYADQKVNVVGVSIWERSPSAVAPFVKERDTNATSGDEMDYRVAVDDVPPLPSGVQEGTRAASEHAGKGKMATTWMQAAGMRGIPTVFIVDREGRIAWIGHPMDGMDEALAQIAAGTWDLDKARESAARSAEREKIVEEIQERLLAGAVDEAMELAREHVDGALADDAEALNGIAWVVVDPEGEVHEQHLDLALKAAERANQLTHGKDPNVLDTLARVCFTRGDRERALELQTKAVELAPSDEAREMLGRTLEEYQRAAK